MEYGKEITTKSYYGGELRSTKTERVEDTRVKDKTELVQEVLMALDLAITGSSKVTIEIAPSKDAYMLITKKWVA